METQQRRAGGTAGPRCAERTVRALVIGVGSPNGEEAVGLRVAERLAREELPVDVVVMARDRPGLRLLDDLDGAPAAVLVDARRSGDTPGVVRRGPHLPLALPHPAQAFILGAGEALSHARRRGRPLPALRLVSIEIAASSGTELSPAVSAAVATACAAARAALAELLAEV